MNELLGNFTLYGKQSTFSRNFFLGLFVAVSCVISKQVVAQDAISSIDAEVIPILDSGDEEIYVTIQNINIVGNEKTNQNIILRELGIAQGDIVQRDDLEKMLENDKNKLNNTRLFLSINFSINDLPLNLVDILIEVKERWYLFPVPIFKIESRNFNEWWVNQNRDFSRVSYGMKFFQYNFRGRNEKLKLQAQFGFTRKFELDYSVPYIDKRQRHGLKLRAGYFENNNINYLTENNRQQFVGFGKQTRTTSYGSMTYSHRPSFYSFHYFTLLFQNTSVNDSVPILNPNYFLDGRSSQRMFRFHYRYRKELRDNVAYPLKGYMFNFEIDKLGLGIYDDINQLKFSADYYRYFDLGHNYYLSARIGGNISFPKQQPYINRTGLGYGANNIRGYELNVIDGQSFFLNKLTFKKRLFYTEARINTFKHFNTIPLSVYLKTYFDGGYVNNTIQNLESDRLSNKYVFGTGFGLDFVTYYDFVLRVEYSINNEGRGAWFLNFKSDLR